MRSGILVLAAVAVPGVVTFLFASTIPPWVGPCLAVGLVVGLKLVLAKSESSTGDTSLRWASTAGAAVLLALSAHMFGRVAQQWHELPPPPPWPTVDLTQGESVPASTRAAVVRGYLRDEWSLDEYRVAANDRPDQNAPAPYRLVPLLDTADEPTSRASQVIVARIESRHAVDAQVVELRGIVRPLPAELAQTLVSFGDNVSSNDVDKVLLDTIDIPVTDELWPTVLIALVLTGAAGSLLLGSSGSTTAPASPSADAKASRRRTRARRS